MKKVLVLAISALLFTGAFAHPGKKCGKGCCKKEASAKKDVVNKATKSTPAAVKKG